MEPGGCGGDARQHQQREGAGPQVGTCSFLRLRGALGAWFNAIAKRSKIWDFPLACLGNCEGRCCRQRGRAPQLPCPPIAPMQVHAVAVDVQSAALGIPPLDRSVHAPHAGWVALLARCVPAPACTQRSATTSHVPACTCDLPRLPAMCCPCTSAPLKASPRPRAPVQGSSSRASCGAWLRRCCRRGQPPRWYERGPARGEGGTQHSQGEGRCVTDV